MGRSDNIHGSLETSRDWRKIAKGLLSLAAVTLVITLQSSCADTSVEVPADELVIALELTAPLATTSGHAVVISPDGRNIVYMGEHEGEQHLFVYSLEAKSTRLIEGSERVRRGPIFSPDSESIAFTAGGKLRRVLLSGGGFPKSFVPRPLSGAPTGPRT